MSFFVHCVFYWNSLFRQFTKIYSFEILLKHEIVIPQICVLNFQHVKGNFGTHKHYHLKLSIHKFLILNFQP